ncbi:MAG: hypothetical protein LBJ04_16500 [Sphingobacterium sp.]|jgi:uncharacterized membrane protein HdeD (DUF308 family)|uniref:hypothetical protein n=1 Tax=Sphingobacterium sp. TaxID=341027 RepID=UPI00282547F6|nr:hypothetical protein [Sphingobacterium sp.]MDR0264819.1 hypothetical protein [Sphingobacterium sp.]
MSKIERMTGWVFLLSGIVLLLIGIAMFFTHGTVNGESTGRIGETVYTSISPNGYFGIALILFIVAIMFLWKRLPKLEDQ